MAYCAKCGRVLNSDGTCSRCNPQYADDRRTGYADATEYAHLEGIGKISFGPAPARRSPKAWILVAMTIILLISAGIGTYIIVGTRSYKKTARLYIESMYNRHNGKQLTELIPKKIIKSAVSNGMIEDRSDIEQYCNDVSDENVEYMTEYVGNDYILSYDITAVSDYDDDTYDEMKDFYDDAGVKVDDAVVLSLALEAEGDTDTYTEDGELYLIKSGSKWYLDFFYDEYEY